jgi:hypothetical protein
MPTLTRCLVLACVLASAAAACRAAGAEKTLFDFEGAFDFAAVQATDAKVTPAKAPGGGAALALATGHAQPWPGIVLPAPGGTWDLAAFMHVALDVTNTGANSVTVNCRVDNDGADGVKNCNTESLTLAPGARGTLTVAFNRRMPAVKGVELFGMRGYPLAGADGERGTIDPARVTGLVIFVARPNADHAFTIDNIRAGGKYAAPKDAAGLTADTFFPFIDTFGQYIHRDWPGKTHSLDDLAKARAAEEKDLAAHPGPKNWNRYGGWAAGPQLEAKGFFYAAKNGGKWHLVDPEGRLFFSHGIDCVNIYADTPLDDRDRWWQDFPGERPEFKEFLGRAGHVIRDYYKDKRPRTFNFAGANLKRKYGDGWREAMVDVAHRRLRSWGMNTLGNWSAGGVYLARRTPYVCTVYFNSPPIAGSSGYWGQFKDPFHADFAKNVRASIEREQGRTAGDAMCIGYFVDNEIAWGDETSLAAAALESPADQPAKQAFLADLKAKYADIGKLNAAWGTSHESWDALAQAAKAPDKKRAAADLGAFYTRIAEEYFRVIRDAVKAVAPRQLYLGCRFAWGNDRASRAAVKFCDVVSYNRYQRSVADLRLPDGADRPVIIGEFHFGALDRGLFHTGLVPVATQEERAAAYKTYVQSAIDNPLIVGCHWFQYMDESTTGRPLDNENYQIGFVDICDTPYPETVRASREVAEGMYGK